MAKKLIDKLPKEIICPATAAYFQALGIPKQTLKGANDGDFRSIMAIMMHVNHVSMVLRYLEKSGDNIYVSDNFWKYRMVRRLKKGEGPKTFVRQMGKKTYRYYHLTEDDGLGMGSWLHADDVLKLEHEFIKGKYYINLVLNDTHYHVEDEDLK